MLYSKDWSVKIPNNVSLFLKRNVLIIEGPLGVQKLPIPIVLFFSKELTRIYVTNILLNKNSFTNNSKKIVNAIQKKIKYLMHGVQFGFHKQLVIVGVGYKVIQEKNDKFLNFRLGYSHPVLIKIPSNLEVNCSKGVMLTIRGISKQDVNNFAALIRSKKLPEPYKGKGIKYSEEVIVKKEGKRS